MAQAQAIRKPTREEWHARALELADARHLTGTARILSEDATGYRIVYGVRKSGPVGEYMVLVTPRLGEIICDCLAGQHRRACAHAGAALHAFRQRQHAIRQPDTDALAVWRRGGEW